jgi:hypothetical protein
MPTIALDKKTRVTFVAATPGIADISAPTVTELNGGTDIQDFMTPDGLNLPVSTGSIDTSNLGSDFTTSRVGRRGISGASLKLQRQTQAADPTANMLAYQEEGFLVVRRGIDKDTTWTAGDEVKVYPIQCGEETEPQSGPEQVWTYEVPIVTTAAWETKAAVAAGA